MQEKNTWQFAYPILTTFVDRLIGGYQSPSIDGYLKYLGQCSGISVRIPSVVVWRQHVQRTEVFHTSVVEADNKELLFRQNKEMKLNLVNDCYTVLSHNFYRVLDQNSLDFVNISWIDEPFIENGPTGLR